MGGGGRTEGAAYRERRGRDGTGGTGAFLTKYFAGKVTAGPIRFEDL